MDTSDVASTSSNTIEELSPVSVLNKQIEKLTEIRKKRLEKKKIDEIIEIECPSPNQFNFKVLFEELIQTRTCPYECFQIILNSMKKHFSTNFGIDSSKEIGTFLNNYFSRVFEKHYIDLGSEKSILECKLLCLIEIHLLRIFPRPLSQTTIVPRIRSLFFASDPEDVRKFLNETICDEFINDLEFCLAGIYGELLIDVPPDLIAFQSEEQKSLFDRENLPLNLPSIEDLRETNNASSRLTLLLAENAFNSSDSEFEDETNQNSSDKLDISVEFPQRVKRVKLAGNFDQDNPKLYHKYRRPFIHVPETPEDKLKNSRLSETIADESWEEERQINVIPQTPIGKIKKERQTSSSKLTQLLKKEEMRVEMGINNQKLIKVQQPEQQRDSNGVILKNNLLRGTASRRLFGKRRMEFL